MGKPDYDDGDNSDGKKGEEAFPMVSFSDREMETPVDEVKYKPEEKKEKKKKEEEGEGKGIMDLISKHAEKSSLSGVSFIHSSKYWTVKIIWTLLLLISLGVMLYHLHELSKKFYQYEKQTQVSLTKGNIPFPAVTLCNVNTMRASKVYMASKRLQDLIKKVDPDALTKDVDDWTLEYENETIVVDDGWDDGEDVVDGDDRSKRSVRVNNRKKKTIKSRSNNFLDDFNVTDVLDDDSYHEDDYSRPSYRNSWEAESKPASLDRLSNRFTAMYFKENSTTRQDMGHQIQDMLIQCSFAGRKCVQRNFTLVGSSTMGNCYTIQYKKFISRQGGPSNGLSLILYLEPDEYIPGITNSKGAQIVVHEPQTVPFPGSEGISVSAGMFTSIGMRKIDIRRLGQPHGDCRDNEEFQKKYGMKYTTQTCQQVCLLERIRDECGCYDETKPIFYKQFAKYLKNMRPCQDKKDLQTCMSDTEWNFNTNHKRCHCSSPCRETSYRHTISARPWPNTAFARLITKTVCKEKPEAQICKRGGNMDFLTLRENFLKVTIYLETLDYEELNEEEDYTIFQFVSDIGGTIGLYVGLSVLGAFEFVHLLVAVLRHFLCRSFTPC